MERKPSSIHSKKIRKFTRRRLIKELSLAGFGAASIAALTVDDVKGASSDQVPISMNFEGTDKVMVSSDWYDRLIKARRVWRKVRNNWLNEGKKDEENDVVGVWLDAGKGNDNPNVIISIDKDSNSKAETRGRIPERKDGVRVEVEETPREEELCDDILCSTPGADWENNTKWDTSTLPGGFPVQFRNPRTGVWGGVGTLTSRVLDVHNYDFNTSFMTNAHVAESAHDDEDGYPCGSELIGHEAYYPNTGDFIGYVEAVSHRHDFVLIHDSNNTDRPLSEVWDVENHSRQFPVADTLTADGVDYLINNSLTTYKYGCGHGEQWGEVGARGQKEAAAHNEYCTAYWYDTVRWGEFCHMGPGDSGSLSIIQGINTSDYFAVNMNGWRWFDYSAGVAGYAIYNDHGYIFNDNSFTG